MKDGFVRKCLPFLSLFIATVSLVLKFTDHYLTVLCCLLIEVLGLLLLWVFNICFIEKSSYQWLNHIIYIFSKSNKYVVLQNECTYQFLDRNHMNYEKKCRITPSKLLIREYEDRFIWISPHEFKIGPVCTGQKMGNIWKENLWTHYTIDLEHDYYKKEVVETGMRLTELYDESPEDKLFLSSEVYEKTKCIVLIAKIPKELEPVKGQYVVYKSDGKELKREDLEYDMEHECFRVEIHYPRAGRRYLLRWNLKEYC